MDSQGNYLKYTEENFQKYPAVSKINFQEKLKISLNGVEI
jgi:hypothetical protein